MLSNIYFRYLLCNPYLKFKGKPFEVYCSIDNPFELCVWTWPSILNTGSCYLLVNNPNPNCPIRKDGNKCIGNVKQSNSEITL